MMVSGGSYMILLCIFICIYIYLIDNLSKYMRRIIDDDKILVAWCNVCNNYTLYNANMLNIDKDNNVCYIYCEHCMNNINIGEIHNEKI
jgi:hypothetical protein